MVGRFDAFLYRIRALVRSRFLTVNLTAISFLLTYSTSSWASVSHDNIHHLNHRTQDRLHTLITTPERENTLPSPICLTHLKCVRLSTGGSVKNQIVVNTNVDSLILLSSGWRSLAPHFGRLHTVQHCATLPPSISRSDLGACRKTHENISQHTIYSINWKSKFNILYDDRPELEFFEGLLAP